MVTVAAGFGVAGGTGEGLGSGVGVPGVLGAQETISAANSREARMRARFVIGGVLINYGVRTWSFHRRARGTNVEASVRCSFAD